MVSSPENRLKFFEACGKLRTQLDQLLKRHFLPLGPKRCCRIWDPNSYIPFHRLFLFVCFCTDPKRRWLLILSLLVPFLIYRIRSRSTETDFTICHYAGEISSTDSAWRCSRTIAKSKVNLSRYGFIACWCQVSRGF
ncbi:hypothetical protein CsatA_024791 [Cannabis sativa]